MTNAKLDNLVTQFYEDKSELDKYKAICNDANAEIKSIMTELDVDKYTVGDITATKSVKITESFNEDKLINLLEHSTYTNPDTGIGNILISTGLGIVKMKPYVDMDALEEALYKGLIPEDVIIKMNDCKEVKETVSLRVTKKRRKNDDVE